MCPAGSPESSANLSILFFSNPEFLFFPFFFLQQSLIHPRKELEADSPFFTLGPAPVLLSLSHSFPRLGTMCVTRVVSLPLPSLFYLRWVLLSSSCLGYTPLFRLLHAWSLWPAWAKSISGNFIFITFWLPPLRLFFPGFATHPCLNRAGGGQYCPIWLPRCDAFPNSKSPPSGSLADEIGICTSGPPLTGAI